MIEQTVVCMECQVTVSRENAEFVDNGEFGFGFVCYNCIHEPFYINGDEFAESELTNEEMEDELE